MLFEIVAMMGRNCCAEGFRDWHAWPSRAGLLAAALLLLLFAAEGRGQERVVRKQITVSAPLAEVWKAWTTREGVESWLAPRAHVQAAAGGAYELLFLLDRPYGSQGNEGCRVLSLIPQRMLAVTWRGAPPDLGAGVVRDLHTYVFVRFEASGPETVRVDFSQFGWGEGESWDKAFGYFVRAWDIVLGRLRKRFETGPIEWQTRPHPSQSLAAEDSAFRERVLRKERLLNTGVDAAWRAWTTAAGVTEFFAGAGRIDPTPGGSYELYFLPDKAYGSRGTEGGRVHSIVPFRSLAFTWNVPPAFGVLRGLPTLVALGLERGKGGATKLRLAHLGWGQGELWDRFYDYCDALWDDALNRLQSRFAAGK